MILTAMIVFKNEEHNLPNCLRSISGIVDKIIGFDDGSEDSSASIFESYGGVLVGEDSNLSFSNGQEALIRTLLLDEAKAAGATHYLCIDADEYFSATFRDKVRNYSAQLVEGQKLLAPWVNLAGDGNYFFTAGGSFGPSFKDFIVRDSENLSYPNDSILHFSRTPSPSFDVDPLFIDESDGAVMHTQHLHQAFYELKQAKYKCLELIKSNKSAFQINENTRFTLDGLNELSKLKEEYKSENNYFAENSIALDAVLRDIEEYFRIFGVEYFEKLEIWHLDSLKKQFVSITNRVPRQFYAAKFFRKLFLKVVSILKKVGD